MAAKKNLMETLNEMEPKTVVKIGCEDDSNFFYVGTVEDVIALMPQLCKKLEETLATKLRRQKKTYSEKKRDLKTVLNDPKAAGSIDACIEKAFRCLRIVQNLQSAWNFYQPISERTVLDVYEAIDMPATCIILPGVDHGEYWNLDEYNADPKSLKVQNGVTVA